MLRITVTRSIFWLALISWLAWVSATPAEPPAYFRADSGVLGSPSHLPADLNAPGALLWRVPLAPGHSSPILAEGKIYLTTARPESNELATIAVDAKTGQVIWSRSITAARLEQTHRIGSAATATPAVEGNRVFVFFGSAGVFCYGLDGSKIWEQPLGPFRDEYGAGSSPIICEGRLILNQDHDIDSFLVALDSATGRVLWKVPRPDAVRSYSTPAVWTQNGRKQLLVAGALQLSAYDPSNGERLWWVNGLARIVIPTPVILGKIIYMASWAPGGDSGKRLAFDAFPRALEKWDQNHDGKLSRNEIDDQEVLERFYRMDLDQDGALDPSEWDRHAAIFRRAQNSVLAIKPEGKGELPDQAILWKHTRGIPYVATPVVHAGILYMVKEGGLVTKLDALTGTLLQEERIPAVGNYFASPVAGDEKVYFASESGAVSVVAAEKPWRVLSSREFHEKIYATPLLAANRIYLRTERALYCFQGEAP